MTRHPTRHLIAFALVAFVSTSCAIAEMVAYDDSYDVLRKRQRFIGLRAIRYASATLMGTDREPTDPDDFHWTITDVPDHGRLYGTPPNLWYVHTDRNPVDSDSFAFEVLDRNSGEVDSGRIRISIRDDYDPPFGIPAPPFGILDSHRMYLDPNHTYSFNGGIPRQYPTTPAGDPYTHYVDLTNGDDSGNNVYGTPQRPRKTIPAVVDAGSIVEIHGVMSTTMAPLTIRVNGVTGTKPVYFRGADPGSKPIVRQAFDINANYVIVENIDFDCSGVDPAAPEFRHIIFVAEEKHGNAWETFDHIAIRHCHFHDYPADVSGGGVAIFVGVTHVNEVVSPNNSTDLSQFVVAYDIAVHDFGNIHSTEIYDLGGVHFAANSRYGWLLDSHIHHVQGDAAAMTRNNALDYQAPSADIYIGRNHFHHCRENAIDIKMVKRGVVSQNWMYRFRRSTSSAGDAIPIHNPDAIGPEVVPDTADNYYSDALWILFNEIYDAHRGISITNNIPEGLHDFPLSDERRIRIVGNLFHDIHSFDDRSNNFGTCINVGAMQETKIWNNTFHRFKKGVDHGCMPTEIADANSPLDLRNNIFADAWETGEWNVANHIRICRQEMISNSRCQMDDNCHFGNIYFQFPAELSDSYESSMDLFQGVQGLLGGGRFCEFNVDRKPQFINARRYDYRLDSFSSPCVGVGTWDPDGPDNVYEEFENDFATGGFRGANYGTIRHDFAGTVYQPHDRLSIGAFK